LVEAGSGTTFVTSTVMDNSPPPEYSEEGSVKNGT
jgi:hypothetical protein